MKHRIAVSLFFFSFGFLYSNWVSRLPELKHLFNVSNSGLGSMLFAISSGGLIAMPFVSWLTTKFGTRNSSIAVALMFCCILPFIPANYTTITNYITFILLGIMGSSLSISMNGQAVYVERMWGKAIMSSFHGLFSIGMALGALSGSLFSKFGIPIGVHLSVIALAGVISFTINYRNLIPDPEDLQEEEVKEESRFTFPTKAILPLGIIAFCGMTGEGSMADWSAIFMHNVVGKSEAVGAIAFGAFAAAMTVGRFAGDYLIRKMGKQNLLITDSILAISGLCLAISIPSTFFSVLGFIIVGLGLSTVVPIIYSTAGNTEGVAPSVGIAMATSVGNLGFFIGPPTIGYLADLVGLRVGLVFPVLLFCIMFFFVFSLKRKKSRTIQAKASN